jgi:hypothetical protein
MKEFDDLDDTAEAPRTAIFPVVAMPTWVADLAGYVLIAAAAVMVAAGAVLALFAVGMPIHQRFAFGDRVELLARTAGAFTAVLALLGVVCLVMAGATGDRRHRRRMAALRAAAVVAAVVLVANGALCAETVAHVGSSFTPPLFSNRLATVLESLAPMAVSGGVLVYVVLYFRSETEPARR